MVKQHMFPRFHDRISNPMQYTGCKIYRRGLLMKYIYEYKYIFRKIENAIYIFFFLS